MDKAGESNLKVWDSWVEGHAGSEFYDVAGFKAGRCTLKPIEVAEVGDVAGMRLLHLQCHFGMDTLSWARRGARVTGADFSPKAISLATSLAVELDLPAEFVCSDIYDLPQNLEGKFDIVYTSAGVLCWLADLAGWARVIAQFLAPDGFFYIREFHPFAGMLDDGADAPRVRYPYFHQADPLVFDGGGDSYAGGKTPPGGATHEWPHSLSDVIQSLIDAGLRIEFLHEFPFTTYQAYPFLKRGDDGLWRYPGGPDLPLMFSVKASAGS